MKGRLFLYILSALMLFTSCQKKANSNAISDFKTNILFKGDLPIVSFDVNGTNMNFVLDSGSEVSLIDVGSFEREKDSFIVMDSTQSVISTVSGTTDTEYKYIVNTMLNDSIYCEFMTFKMDNVIKNVFLSNGVLINGLIGCDMLREHGMVIDFDKEILYN